jgi:hypothetical protein
MKRFVLSEVFQRVAYASYYSLGAREAVADLGFLQSRSICARSVSAFFARCYRRVDQRTSVARCSSFVCSGSGRDALCRGANKNLYGIGKVEQYVVCCRSGRVVLCRRARLLISGRSAILTKTQSVTGLAQRAHAEHNSLSLLLRVIACEIPGPNSKLY